jgi:phosphatidylserine decarboxylase
MLAHTPLGFALALALALPVARKWQLRLPGVIGSIALGAIAAGGIVEALRTGVGLSLVERVVVVAALALAASCAMLAYRFFRDPERVPPEHGGAVVSPADGEVVYVREARAGALPVISKHGRSYTLRELTRTQLEFEDAVVIGIGMTFSDVHVNRAPIAGEVSLCRHFAGRFGSLRQPEMVFENERATTVLEGDSLQVAVVQIASRLVRQIVSFVDAGQQVELGQRIGLIRFGSQVDVVLPLRPDVRVLVKPRDRVRAGESVIASQVADEVTGAIEEDRWAPAL